MSNGSVQGIDVSHYQGTVQGIDCPVDLDLLQGPIANLAALTLA